MLDVMPWEGSVEITRTFFKNGRPPSISVNEEPISSWETMTALCKALAIDIAGPHDFELDLHGLDEDQAARCAVQWRLPQ